MDIDPQTALVRQHPEYHAMFRNLSDTQARCSVLLNTLRDVKTGILRRYTFEELLLLCEKGLNPPPV
jgi:hypothetical protein